MSSVGVVELMQKIPQKVRDIEGIKEEYRRRKDQLDAKYKTELAGIEDKIGKILQERTEDLVTCKNELKKAEQKLKEAREYLAKTREKVRKNVQDAQNALKRQVDVEIDAIQKEIRFTQKQIQEKEKNQNKSL